MNYVRIYEAFIQDRRAKEAAITGYSERHHIVPRCMDGNDSPDNLIDLTPEDHFFAHLVLAKAYGGRELWAACLLMSETERRLTTLKFRRMYGIVRRRWNEASIGEDAPNADLSEYTFYHIDGYSFTGTRIAFSVHSKVPPASINALVRGVQSIVYDWALKPITRQELDVQKTARATQAGLALKGFVRKPQLHHFYNRAEERSAIATQIGMMNLGYLDKNGASALVLKARFVSNGWCLIENEATAYDQARKSGKNAYNFREETYTIVNAITGESRSGTISDLGRLLNNGDARPIGEVVNRRRRGWRGWHLEGSQQPRVSNMIYQMVNRVTGERIMGSQAELCSRIGVTKMAVNNVLKRRAPHTRNWIVCD